MSVKEARIPKEVRNMYRPNILVAGPCFLQGILAVQRKSNGPDKPTGYRCRYGYVTNQASLASGSTGGYSYKFDLAGKLDSVLSCTENEC